MEGSIFTLQWRDVAKGFLTSAITAILLSVYQIIQAGAMPTIDQWKITGLGALTAGVGYLIKNFITNSDDKILTKEPPPEVKVAKLETEIQQVKEKALEPK